MRKTTIAISLAGAVLLGPAAAAQAATTAQGLTCPKPSVHFTQTGIASFESSSSKPGCTVQLSSWAVPDSYDGKGYDASAKPQTLVDRTLVTLTSDPQTVSVKVPASRWCQIDFRAKGGTYLYGRIVECHHPVAVVHPKPPVVTPPKHVVAHKPKTHIVTTARVRSVAPAPQLAYTGMPANTFPLIELAAGCGLLGTALVLAAGFRQSGPKHKELSK